MKYFIKIDRDSIRKNPKWPRSSREPCGYVEGNTDERFTIIDKRDNKYYKIIITDDREVSKETILESEFENLISNSLKLTKLNLPNKFLKYFSSSSLPFLTEYEFNREVEPIYSMYPEPKYLFGYIPTKVQCEMCNEEVYHTELKSDSYDWDCYSDTICPRCDDWDCCCLEFEDIDSVIND